MHIETVLGPIPPEQLGITLMHEHTLVDLWEWGGRQGYNSIVDDEGLLAEELALYRQAGGSALVDVTNIGDGRNPAGLRRLAQATGLHLIMGAGWYRENVYPRYLYERSVDQLADMLIQECSAGVDGTGVRPGILGEIGTERFSISPAEERVFRATARAQRQTGLTITTHTTHFGDLAFEQLAILLDEGVPPARIIIGHVGERRDATDVIAIARQGVFVQIDHVGAAAGSGCQPEIRRARNVVEVVRAGFLEQLLISMDMCANSRLHHFGGSGYDYLLRTFVPLLEQEGLSPSEIHTILVDNPRRALAF
jgi:predicted metal-dependent phosphotriesterase family hydrolase